MTMKENQANVEKLLAERGWNRNGCTHSETHRIVTAKSYPLAGGEVTTGGNPRYDKGQWKATIGKMTTSFYRPEEGVPYHYWRGWKCKTKDIEKIKSIESQLVSSELTPEQKDMIEEGKEKGLGWYHDWCHICKKIKLLLHEEWSYDDDGHVCRDCKSSNEQTEGDG